MTTDKKLLHDVINLDMAVDKVAEMQDAVALHLTRGAEVANVVRALMDHGVPGHKIRFDTRSRNLFVCGHGISDFIVLSWMVKMKSIMGPRGQVVLSQPKAASPVARVVVVPVKTADVAAEYKPVPVIEKPVADGLVGARDRNGNVRVLMQKIGQAKATTQKRIFDEDQYLY